MHPLSPLLEIQALDLAADAARRRSDTLEERDAIARLDGALVEIDARLAQARAERIELQGQEERLGVEVAEVAREIERAELARYSGKRQDRDQAVAHEASQARLRERQAGIEEREMELLEALEAVDAAIDELERARVVNRAEREQAQTRIGAVESETAAELERVAAARRLLVPGIPADVLAAYERVRAQPRARGRGAVALAGGFCGGCRIKLPSLVNRDMLKEPEDALMQCPQCQRVLVREGAPRSDRGDTPGGVGPGIESDGAKLVSGEAEGRS